MRLTVVALAAVAIAFVWPQQNAGWEENAHFALTLALADGVPYIDGVLDELGELGTGDVARRAGHVYAITAPGQPAASVPLALVLEAAGVESGRDPLNLRWALGLASASLPAFLLVLLIAAVAERFARRTGLAVAVAFGLGTLLLPFATLYMSHALSACLAFAAFAVLVHERGRAVPRAGAVAVAGALAGLAVTAEYQTALAGAILGVYAVTRGPVVRTGAAYATGVALGVLPAAAYHQWAFGSPFRAAYLYGPNAELFDRGVLGFQGPSGRHMLELLFSEQGLLVLSPLAALGLAGMVFLYRGGRRAEALTCGAVFATYLVYASGFFTPFGGIWPGPRYLIVTIPFLAAAAAPLARARPLTFAAAALASTATMAALTATHAHAAYHQQWFERLLDREVTTSALAAVGITGWYAMAPFFGFIALAVAAAAASMGRVPASRNDVATLAAVFGGWIAIALGAPRRAELGGPGLEYASYWPVGIVVLALATAIVQLRPWGRYTGVSASS